MTRTTGEGALVALFILLIIASCIGASWIIIH